MTLVALSALIVVALLVLWKVPELQVRLARKRHDDNHLSTADLLKAENDYRSTLAQIFGGIAILAGLYYTGATLRLQQDGQLTDRINKAVEQLGSEKPDVALGGIYQLGRIADDSPRDHWSMMQVLMSYVERHAPLPAESGAARRQDCDPLAFYNVGETVDLHVQAIANILRQRRIEYESSSQHVAIVRSNLRHINLSGANLNGANLVGNDFGGGILTDASLDNEARLSYSLLDHANLSSSRLPRAHLEHACLVRAQLTNADFGGAHLEEADLRNVVDAGGANFAGAALTGCDLRGADLTHANGLTLDQLSKAIIDCTTLLPSNLRAATRCGP